MVNVILRHYYIDESWDGKTGLASNEKLLGTFFDDQEAEKWVESEKENNPIFKTPIDETGFYDEYNEGYGFAYELVLKKVSLIDKNFHVDESLLNF